MRIAASAPGKLVVLGEYAVLEGAPALVLAVDRRVRATLTTAPHADWEIVSPTLGLSARLRVGPDTIAWSGAPQAELGWVATLLASLPFAASLAACRVELESTTFHLDVRGARGKLGLGSSAALAVALLGALHALAGEHGPTLAECVVAHRAIQHGRGSGIDVAASLAGGFGRFQLGTGGTPLFQSLALPTGLRWCCVYSGRPVATGEMLAGVAAWRKRDPAAFARHLDELATIAARGVQAVIRNDAALFLSSFHDYAHALAAFGEAGGVDIASAEHRALAALAADCGVVYKSCGAGGGDVGVTFSVDHDGIREFAARAVQVGFPVIALDMDPHGLRVDATT